MNAQSYMVNWIRDPPKYQYTISHTMGSYVPTSEFPLSVYNLGYMT